MTEPTAMPITNMNVPELIREAEHTDNKLALRLIECFEEATDLEGELADALTCAYSNVKEDLEGLATCLEQEVFDVDGMAELITEAIAIECDDEGLPEGLADAITAILKRERETYERLIAQAWPVRMLKPSEQGSLNKEVEASSACIDVIEETDFDNPFQAVLDEIKRKAEEEKQRLKELRKANNPQKTTNRKSPKGK